MMGRGEKRNEGVPQESCDRKGSQEGVRIKKNIQRPSLMWKKGRRAENTKGGKNKWAVNITGRRGSKSHNHKKGKVCRPWGSRKEGFHGKKES